MKIVNAMAAGFCENYRVFDRFSSRAVSLQRLGYSSRDINYLLRDTKDEWRRDNIPDGFREQVYPYPCEERCARCEEAYAGRRVSRFRRTLTAFAELYSPRGWLEFQTTTVPPFAPKPEYVHHVLHDTPETSEIFDGWLREYLAARVEKEFESLRACVERWREVGIRRCTNPDEEELWLREYQDMPVRFPRSALRALPEELLSQKEKQRVYGILTNEMKSELKEEAAIANGFVSVDAMIASVDPELAARLEEVLSEIVLIRFRELRDAGELSERVKAWFARADRLTRAKIENDVGFVGDLFSDVLANEIQAAWLHQCWRDGMLQACVENRRVYIPLLRERWVKKDGRYVCRQEYGPDCEPNLQPQYAGVESLPEDCPVYRMPRAVLTEMMDLYRNRNRRKRVGEEPIQFRYIAVEESGASEEHHHIHAVLGFEEPRPPDRERMRRHWHAVSGNIIWKDGRWSEKVRHPDRIGSYGSKYLSKDGGRQTWLSRNLGLNHYNKEKRLQELGLLPLREPKIGNLKKGGFCFEPAFSEEELESAVCNLWVGLTRLEGVKALALPNHYRVDAVARSTKSPSLGAAAGAFCVHRTRGVVSVMPAVDAWLPVKSFITLFSDGARACPAVSKLFRELSVALNRASFELREYQSARNAEVLMGAGLVSTESTRDVGIHYKLQQQHGIRLFSELQSDFEDLRQQVDTLWSHPP